MTTNNDYLNPIWKNPDQLDFTRATQVGTLPIRGEKRLIPVELDLGLTKTAKEAAAKNLPEGGDVVGDPGADVNSYTTPYYEAVSYAKQTFTDYITIRIPSRLPGMGNFQTGGYTFRFMINPHTVNVARQTIDAHSMTRAGWQFGVWGEDTLDISLSGITAGQYFENGLTDSWAEYSLSYRNLLELVNVFENNGYWFEGEEVNQQWNAPDYTRKRIKCHSDVELRLGNFIWSGMFTHMTINHIAENPYYVTFDLGFLAWKERFASNSPWTASKKTANSVYRGHSKELLTKAAADAAAKNAAIDANAAARQASLDTTITALRQTVPSSIPSSFTWPTSAPSPAATLIAGS